MKRRIAAAICAMCVMANGMTSLAFSQYDYEMKYLYDVTFDCLWADFPTFGELVGFQSSNDLNSDLFINSEYGAADGQKFLYLCYLCKRSYE